METSALIDIDIGEMNEDEYDSETHYQQRDPAAYLPYLFPWLAEHGMYIMPMPNRNKLSTAAKKKTQWVKELQNLHSSVNYNKAQDRQQLGGPKNPL